MGFFYSFPPFSPYRCNEGEMAIYKASLKQALRESRALPPALCQQLQLGGMLTARGEQGMELHLGYLWPRSTSWPLHCPSFRCIHVQSTFSLFAGICCKQRWGDVIPRQEGCTKNPKPIGRRLIKGSTNRSIAIRAAHQRASTAASAFLPWKPGSVEPTPSTRCNAP